jgi:hypothetical protein
MCPHNNEIRLRGFGIFVNGHAGGFVVFSNDARRGDNSKFEHEGIEIFSRARRHLICAGLSFLDPYGCLKDRTAFGKVYHMKRNNLGRGEEAKFLCSLCCCEGEIGKIGGDEHPAIRAGRDAIGHKYGPAARPNDTLCRGAEECITQYLSAVWTKDYETHVVLFGHPNNPLESVAQGNLAIAVDAVSFAYRRSQLLKQSCSLPALDVDKTLGLVVIDHVREHETG